MPLRGRGKIQKVKSVTETQRSESDQENGILEDTVAKVNNGDQRKLKAKGKVSKWKIPDQDDADNLKRKKNVEGEMRDSNESQSSTVSSRSSKSRNDKTRKSMRSSEVETVFVEGQILVKMGVDASEDTFSNNEKDEEDAEEIDEEEQVLTKHSAEQQIKDIDHEMCSKILELKRMISKGGLTESDKLMQECWPDLDEQDQSQQSDEHEQEEEPEDNESGIVQINFNSNAARGSVP